MSGSVLQLMNLSLITVCGQDEWLSLAKGWLKYRLPNALLSNELASHNLMTWSGYYLAFCMYISLDVIWLCVLNSILCGMQRGGLVFWL